MEKKEVTIFDDLFSLNVNSNVEEKNGLKYLSWAWAWAEVKKKYPNAYYSIERFGEEKKPYLYDSSLGYMVFTRVNINGEEHEMWLPVMDSNNKAMLDHSYTYDTKYKKDIPVAKATMFDINKTIMRCLVKNLAMFGLGLYIYAGEDLPEQDSDNQEQLITPNQIAKIKKYYQGDNFNKLLEANNIKIIDTMTKAKAEELINKIENK